jgi:hypothetical protein
VISWISNCLQSNGEHRHFLKRGVRIYEWRKRYIPLNRQNRLRIPATKVIAKQQDSYVQNRVYDKIAESMSDISLIRCYEKVRRGWISSA